MKYDFISVVTISSILLSSIVGVTVLLKSRKIRQFNLPLVLYMFSSNICIFNSGFLIHSRNYRTLPHLLSFSWLATFLVGPFFYIYIKQLLFPNERIRKILHFIPFFTAMLLTLPIQVKGGVEKILLVDKMLSGTTTIPESIYYSSYSIIGVCCMIMYFIHAYYLLGKKKQLLKRSDILKEKKLENWLSFVVYNNLFFISILFTTILVAISSGFTFYMLYRSVPLVTGFSICIFSLWILFHPELFLLDRSGTYTPFTSTSHKESKGVVEEIMKKKIEMAISEDELYKDPELTLPELARKIGIPRTTLSKTINSVFNMNFYDFINTFRIEAFKKEIAAAPWDSNILETALALGFRSKTTFNTCFKRYENMTPSQFKCRIMEKEKSEYSII